ncbi:RNA-directed DNA polymerase, eukaryota [Artemisia annua]|uniref:RNA-directed DNA polymerase, eukaryota n=1 Tax=Artemisia annua TaxID=35608 RepID=A0A2U1N8Q9_ARTAN|nr:RNA-directed DNA polymerase, eukaryota [Artemisia annua]
MNYITISIYGLVSKGIFKGLSLASDGTNISLLQYADDALFFGDWSVSNARRLVHILDCFHDVSGLKINLSKSRLFGIGIPLDEVANGRMIDKRQLYKRMHEAAEAAGDSGKTLFTRISRGGTHMNVKKLNEKVVRLSFIGIDCVEEIIWKPFYVDDATFFDYASPL